MCVCKQMQGHLQAQGLRVQRLARDSVSRRVDPEGSIMRRLSSMEGLLCTKILRPYK